MKFGQAFDSDIEGVIVITVSPRQRAGRKAHAPSSPFDFDYDEFAEWYDWIAAARLQPARITFTRLINEWLDRQLNDLDRYRIKVASSRVKGIGRLWTKMQKDEYISKITDLTSIPAAIDDLVGIRLTCHNNIDMKTLREMIGGLPSSEEDNDWLCALPDTEKRYVDNPKPTGYRAYHINVRTLLQTPEGWVPVIGELQARTLLQDGWGELTHEDTYKAGLELPPLATKLARRMADLLAAVDDLAQDLRDELDGIAEASIQGELEEQDETPSAPTEPVDLSAATREALVADTKRVVQGLTKPAPLAEIAQRIQASFGTSISQGWGGFGSFAELVRTAAPGSTVRTDPPGIVIPAGYIPPKVDPDGHGTKIDVPPIVIRLHAFDKDLPLVPGDKMAVILDAIYKCLNEEVWNELEINPHNLGIREVNALTKWARDTKSAEGDGVGRNALDYFIKALLFRGNLMPGLPHESIAALLASNVLDRAASLGLVTDASSDRPAVRRWFGVV